MLFDTHAHLTFSALQENIDEVLSNCRERGVTRIMSIACSPEDHKEDLALIAELAHRSQEPRIYGAAGIHPDHFNNPAKEDTSAEILQLKKNLEMTFETYKDLLIAVGECGLDYYREYHKGAQQELFRMQLEFAAARDLPVVIHAREAWEDLFTILTDYPKARFVIHCFTGGPAEAERILTWENSMISISGIVSFKNAADIQAAVPCIPLDRLLIETDSPYLAPVPHRGKSNQPAFVADVASAVADILKTTPEDIGKRTTENALRFLRLS